MTIQVRLKTSNLVVKECPLSCNKTCNKVFENKDTGHKIICECTCHIIKEK